MIRTFFGRLFLAIPIFPLIISSYAQTGPIESVQPNASGAKMQVGRVWLQLTAIAPTAFRVQYAKTADFKEVPSFAVAEPLPELRVERHDTAREIVISTGRLSAAVDRGSGALRFLDAAGHVISGEKPGYGVEFQGDAFRVYRSMPLDEHYFGLGDKAAPIDHRDQAFTMWNTDAPGWIYGTDPLYKSIPFFLALRNGKAYGIYLDNTYRSSFEFAKEQRDAYSFGADGGALDYYFFYGPDPKSVLSQYTALTGHTPLPPRWALGYQQSRFSYYPESRVYEIAKDLREKKIPADVIYLDIDYLQGYKAFDINRTYFPTFGKMVQDLAKDNFKLVVISDLHLKVEKGYPPYDQGIAGDDFVKNPDGSVYEGVVWPGMCAFPDFTLQRVRDWYGSLYKDFAQMGVAGFWNDMNEPSVFRYPEKTMPLDTVHRVDQGGVARTTDHREIHNVYGMEQVRATYDGLKNLAPNLRPFVLTRAAFAGTQRYAATWTGDNQATWEHYRLTVPTLLSLGISGYAFAGNDTGGFNNSPTPELATRWFEVGAFTPLFRDHNSDDTMPKEPWVHGPVNEAIRRRFIEERYRLLPYLYTAFEENSRDGLPIMRPLFLEYPDIEQVENDSEYFFGHDLLVAPKMDEGLNPLQVLLPPGDWFDYWSGEKVEGAHEFAIEPALDRMPVYVRAGAIIPEQPLVQSTAEVPQGALEVRVYPGPECRGSIYWDDGESFDYQKGQYYRQSFTCESDARGVTVKLSAPEGSYQPWWKTIKVVVYGTRAKDAAVNGAPATPEVSSHASAVVFPASREAATIQFAY